MSNNHPNRSAKTAATPEKIIALRVAAGLTQDACAKLCKTNLRSWQRWESGDTRPSYCTWVGIRTIIACAPQNLYTIEKTTE